LKNAEATKTRILEAALAEFSAYGVAGSRVDRIAEKAQCNKNLIYIYFENKDGLLNAVLDQYLTGAYQDVLFDPQDLPGYAQGVFDLVMDRPDIMRLMAWVGLEKSAAAKDSRIQSKDVKVQQISDKQKDGTLPEELSPAFILTLVMSLATAWSDGSVFGPVLASEELGDLPSLRQQIGLAVALVCGSSRRETNRQRKDLSQE